ncbi:unnamed protein product [Rotaria sp. Silwood2]|nr:unnamed protein product [Rotaria sp. Silwood2]CAF4434574.1 unnamed protein product [Rotaria sp. Silwood2]
MTGTETKRILLEIEKLQGLAADNNASSVQFLLDKTPLDNPGSNVFLGRILPKTQIYNQAAFQIEINLPAEYPFKPPEVRVITPIYHPNVGDRGYMPIELVSSAESFKPTTSLVIFVKAVVDRIDNPDMDHALNLEIAAEYVLSL